MLRGIIDVLWDEVKTNWMQEHSDLTGNDLAQAWEEYQISLTEKANTERGGA